MQNSEIDENAYPVDIEDIYDDDDVLERAKRTAPPW